MSVLVLLAAGGYWLSMRKPAPGAAVQSWTPVAEQTLSHGRFENFSVFVPHATARGFVLLLGTGGAADPAVSQLAQQIAARGALVARLDVTKFNASLQTDGGQCVYPDGDLENLSHFVQAYFHLPTYLSPLLVGEAAGGTLAYATLVQAPGGTFGGAISLGFCPAYELRKPLCRGSGIDFAQTASGVDFLPSKQPQPSWQVVQDDSNPACGSDAVREFVAKVPGARFTSNPKGGSDQLVSAVEEFMVQHPAAALEVAPAALADLPIITIPAAPEPPAADTHSADTFALILSGDGGWAGLDKDVAGALAAAGIPVVGLDSLRYFWTARTPDSLAADLDRLVSYYLTALGKRRVLLIGYSQGADVLPFAVNRLKADTRSHVGLTAIMGMSEHALFEFHVANWISDDSSGPATLPEVERVSGIPVLCVYGSEEEDTLCPKLDPHKVTIVKLKGGHHFDGDYAGLARLILTAAQTHAP